MFLDTVHIATFLMTGLPVIATSFKSCWNPTLDMAAKSYATSGCASATVYCFRLGPLFSYRRATIHDQIGNWKCSTG